jgi:hypothetical protein
MDHSQAAEVAAANKAGRPFPPAASKVSPNHTATDSAAQAGTAKRKRLSERGEGMDEEDSTESGAVGSPSHSPEFAPMFADFIDRLAYLQRVKIGAPLA